MAVKTETYEFQAETKQLLNIVIHSLYTDKEIFLRELISNASDALDRLRFEALKKPELLEPDDELEIRLDPDADAKTLTISDNGIGMSRKEVIENLGTIAKSGTRDVIEKLKRAKSSDQAAQLIGQFGVGFYSAFMVADQVEVQTRRADQKTGTRWVSQADGTYTVETVQREQRGTSITLHLKPADPDEGLEDFSQDFLLERLIKRYSDFVAYPIKMRQKRQVREKDEEGQPKEDGKTETVIEDKTLNSMKPLWARPQSEVKEEEYNEFYKHIAHDWEDPLAKLTFRAEGVREYQALLYIPSRAPFDLFFPDADYGLQLYARRVNIMDSCRELLPRYLRFLKGVVDSSDFPLNISRQRLQNDRHVLQIRRWLTRKVLDGLRKMQREQEDDYLKFYTQFGAILKEGIGQDPDNKKRLLPLLMFESSHDPEKLTTFDEYVERMKDDQKAIYYLQGESRALVENSPHLESFREKGIEVLFLTEPVDELLTQQLSEVKDKPLRSAAKGEFDLPGDEEKDEEAKKQEEEERSTFKDLTEALQKKLEDKVREVRLSKRLTESPACLVGGENDPSPHFQRLMEKAQMAAPGIKPILEINPKHPVITSLKDHLAKDKDDPVLNDYADLLLGYGLISQGSELPDPSRFNKLLADLMAKAL
ncbi:MAG TPA: molecular chaperone HtpG [Acidobacteriota bacterium]|nr:molecular chaperone HtpG [Acidobacteriota bacterium]